jgi:hypothetical protein
MRKVLEEGTRPRWEKLLFLEVQMGSTIGKAANPVSQRGIVEKTFTKYFCIFNK